MLFQQFVWFGEELEPVVIFYCFGPILKNEFSYELLFLQYIPLQITELFCNSFGFDE